MNVRRRSHILIIDDNEDMVATLKDILELSDYKIDVAFDGATAIERMRRNNPDSVLMDIRMPGSSCIEAFREITTLSPTPFVIFMTGFATSSLVEEAHREGALEMLPEPIDIDRVSRLLKETAARESALIVHDDPAFRTTLKDALVAESLRVDMAYDLDSAFAALQSMPASMTILDMQPTHRSELEGLVIFKKLVPHVIAILVSAAGFQEGMGNGLKSSAYAAFTKPFDVDLLLRVIHDTLEHRRAGR